MAKKLRSNKTRIFGLRNKVLSKIQSADLGQKLGTAINNYLMLDNVLQVHKDEKKDDDPDFTALSVYGLWECPALLFMPAIFRGWSHDGCNF